MRARGQAHHVHQSACSEAAYANDSALHRFHAASKQHTTQPDPADSPGPPAHHHRTINLSRPARKDPAFECRPYQSPLDIPGSARFRPFPWPASPYPGFDDTLDLGVAGQCAHHVVGLPEDLYRGIFTCHPWVGRADVDFFAHVPFYFFHEIHPYFHDSGYFHPRGFQGV